MKVLFLSELASIHAARWVNQFKNSEWEMHAFQGIARNNGVCPEFNTGYIYVPFPTLIPNQLPSQTVLPTKSILVDRVRRKLSTKHNSPTKLEQDLAINLAKLIQTLHPDIIHSSGLNINWQNMMLSIYRAHAILGKFDCPWIYSSWGADLSHYAQLSPAHRNEVSSVLHFCDYHISECERDARIAREIGFRGELLGYLPAFGGVTWNAEEYSSPGSPSLRRTILIKGRDISGGDPQGRAMSIMKALKLCQNCLADYRIVICHAAPEVVNEAIVLQATTKLNIQIIPHLNYNSWLRIMGESRILIAATVTDGLPSTLVEAMSLGVFPVHSGLDSIREWVKDEINGLLIPPEDPELIAVALRRAIEDDKIVDQAAAINRQIVEKRLSANVVKTKAMEMYKRVTVTGRVVDIA